MWVQTLFRKVAIVRDGDERAFEVQQKIFQPFDRFQIEVVGWLVQQQGLRLAEECLRQQRAHLLAALQLAHLALVQFVGDVETLQQDRRIALGGVAVFFADNAFEFAETHTVFVGHLGL